jgi:hypothetical protein
VKLKEKKFETITGLKTESGDIVEVHVIESENSEEKSLMIKNKEEIFSLNYEEISAFIELFSRFLESF